MPGVHSDELARDLLGSARMFTACFSGVCEDVPLAKISQGQLTPSQLRLLELVSLSEGLTIHEVASFLRVSVAAASQAVDRLVRRDLLRRQMKEDDRRTCELSLTRAGKRMLAAYESARQQAVQEVLERFSPGDLRRATELLDRLAVALYNQIDSAEAVCLQCGTYFRERCIVRGLGRHTCFYERYPVRRPR